MFVGISVIDVTSNPARVPDRVTGLPNLSAFQEAANGRLTKYPAEPFAIFKIEMRRIHELNVTFGFDSGDEAARQFGERLRDLVGAASFVARVESRAFAALIPVQVPWGGNFRGLAAAVVAAFEEPLLIHGEPITVEATVGMSFYPGHARDAEFLFRHASVAREVAETDPTVSRYGTRVGTSWPSAISRCWATCAPRWTMADVPPLPAAHRPLQPPGIRR